MKIAKIKDFRIIFAPDTILSPERWNTTLGDSLTRPLTMTDVAFLMIDVKMAREQNSPKRDNLTDIVGYATALAEALRQEEWEEDYHSVSDESVQLEEVSDLPSTPITADMIEGEITSTRVDSITLPDLPSTPPERCEGGSEYMVDVAVCDCPQCKAYRHGE